MLPCLSPKEGDGAAGASRVKGEGSGESAGHGRHTAAAASPSPSPAPLTCGDRRRRAMSGPGAGCRGGRSGSSDGTAAAPLHAPRRRSRGGRGGAGRAGLGGRRGAGRRKPDTRGSVAVAVAVLGLRRGSENTVLWPRKRPRERSFGDCEERIRGCRGREETCSLEEDCAWGTCLAVKGLPKKTEISDPAAPL